MGQKLKRSIFRIILSVLPVQQWRAGCQPQEGCRAEPASDQRRTVGKPVLRCSSEDRRWSRRTRWRASMPWRRTWVCRSLAFLRRRVHDVCSTRRRYHQPRLQGTEFRIGTRAPWDGVALSIDMRTSNVWLWEWFDRLLCGWHQRAMSRRRCWNELHASFLQRGRPKETVACIT